MDSGPATSYPSPRWIYRNRSDQIGCGDEVFVSFSVEEGGGEGNKATVRAKRKISGQIDYTHIPEEIQRERAKFLNTDC